MARQRRVSRDTRPSRDEQLHKVVHAGILPAVADNQGGRRGGALFLAISIALGSGVFYFESFPAKAVFLVPVLGAAGLWMLTFGYPKGEDGMAPLWWRIGIATVSIVAFAATLWLLSPAQNLR